MRVITVLLACLACTGCGRRLQTDAVEDTASFAWHSHPRHVGLPGSFRLRYPCRALAMLLFVLDPAFGWQSADLGCRGQAAANPRRSCTSEQRPLLGRRTFLAAAGAIAASPALPSFAWCGEKVPQWAFSVQWDVNPKLPFTYQGAKGTMFYKAVGDPAREQKDGLPTVLVIGNPGIDFDYMENLEALAVSNRRVIEVTFAGTAPGDLNPAFTTPEACAEQMRAVCRHLKLKGVHVLAHGLGAMPALRFASKSSVGAEDGIKVLSLTLVSPYASALDLRPEALNDLATINSTSELPVKLLPTNSFTAIKSCIAESSSLSGGALLPAILTGRPGEDSLSGSFLNERILQCADNLPVLLVAGGNGDIVNSQTWGTLPASVERLGFPKSGHMPFIEESEGFVTRLLDFLDKVDGKQTNRAFMLSNDTLTMAKELFLR